MSEYFHVIEQSDKRIPERDGMALNNLFKKELGNYGLHPELAVIQSIGESAGQHGGLWSIDFALTEKQSPIYKVYFSPLNGHILRQMARIIVTSSGVYVIMTLPAQSHSPLRSFSCKARSDRYPRPLH
ncbi:MAG: hypothetical protein K2I45_05140 [Muribaculaceae bacterium]|nr:hypothetical protein [Muribaculaceae bacterium]